MNTSREEKIYMAIEPFDILLVRSKVKFGLQSLILAPLIRYFTKSKYNHVAMVHVFGETKVVVEADAKGFRQTCLLKDWIKTHNHYKVLRKKNIDEIEISQMNIRMRDILYKKYDFANTLFHQLVRILSKKDKWIGDASYKRVNCSEAVAYIMDEPYYYKYLPKDFDNNNRYTLVLDVQKNFINYIS